MILDKVSHFKVLPFLKIDKFQDSTKVKMAVFEAPKLPNLISNKICVVGNFLNFHTVRS